MIIKNLKQTDRDFYHFTVHYSMFLPFFITLLIAWSMSLFFWSIPMVILEYAFGRHARASPVNTFHKYLGKNGAWKGGFIVFVQLAVSSYYIVVCSWEKDKKII